MFIDDAQVILIPLISSAIETNLWNAILCTFTTKPYIHRKIMFIRDLQAMPM